jgi:hypothetical protein
LIEKKGETGFKTTLYRGNKRIGTAERPDGKFNIDDIQYDIKPEYEKDLKKRFTNKKSIMIDGEVVKWSIPLAIYCMMENKSMYDNIKKAQQNNKLVIQFEGDDYFSVLKGYRNTPQDLNTVRKNSSRAIKRTGKELIDAYDELREI